MSGCRFGTPETGVGALVSVGVAVVDTLAIALSGCTTPGSLSVCSTPGSVPGSSSLREYFRSFWLSSRDEMSLAWSESSSKESWYMVSVSVANFVRSAAMAVARLSKASTVSDWWSAVELKV